MYISFTSGNSKNLYINFQKITINSVYRLGTCCIILSTATKVKIDPALAFSEDFQVCCDACVLILLFSNFVKSKIIYKKKNIAPFRVYLQIFLQIQTFFLKTLCATCTNLMRRKMKIFKYSSKRLWCMYTSRYIPAKLIYAKVFLKICCFWYDFKNHVKKKKNVIICT